MYVAHTETTRRVQRFDRKIQKEETFGRQRE